MCQRLVELAARVKQMGQDDEQRELARARKWRAGSAAAAKDDAQRNREIEAMRDNDPRRLKVMRSAA